MSKKSKNHLVWIDMEMTGLDPDKENVIEIATIITDTQLNIVAEGPNLVVHQSNKLLSKMDRWNKKQHGKTGLIDQVKASKISVSEAEKQTLAFIKKYCYVRKSPLCGNSIHHDRKFLLKHMPKIDKFLHYRHIDVSSLKAVVKYWYPKDKDMPAKNSTHRALDDIRESIQELQYYREHYFKKPA